MLDVDVAYESVPYKEACNWFHNPALSLAASVSAHISGTRFFLDMRVVQEYSL